MFRGTHLLFALVLVFLLYRVTDAAARRAEGRGQAGRRPAADILDYLAGRGCGGADPLSVRQLRILRHPHLLHRRPVRWTDMILAVVHDVASCSKARGG